MKEETSSVPLLPSSEDDAHSTEDSHPLSVKPRSDQRSSTKSRPGRNLTTMIVPYVIIIILLVVLVYERMMLKDGNRTDIFRHAFPCTNCPLPRLYVRVLIQTGHIALMEDNELSYEHRPLSVKIHDNQFAGLPRPELDAAWHELFESGWFVLQLSALDPERYSSLNRPPLTARVGLDNNIRVSKSDLDFHNVTSLPLADGSGYASQLGVFHELHCLVRACLLLLPRSPLSRSAYLCATRADRVPEKNPPMDLPGLLSY